MGDVLVVIGLIGIVMIENEVMIVFVLGGIIDVKDGGMIEVLEIVF